MDFVHLTGVEDVLLAGRSMQEASQTMQQASNAVVEALYQQRLFLDNWIMQFEEIMNKKGERKCLTKT